MNKKTAGEVLNRLHQVLGVKNDSQLSEAIDINRATVGNWRSRDSVPYSLCVEIAEQRGVRLDWLLTGEGSMLRGADVGASEEQGGYLSNPREQALLTLWRELDEEAQREIQRAAQEKKRLSELESRLSELEAVVADIKGLA